MSWYHRGERRLVEYGSSFRRDARRGHPPDGRRHPREPEPVHLCRGRRRSSRRSRTPGLVTAGVNTYVCRGRVRHPITRPTARRFARGSGSSTRCTGRAATSSATCSLRPRRAPRNFGGGIDRHGGAVGRWLVTRDGFDFLSSTCTRRRRPAPARRRARSGRGRRPRPGAVVEAAGGLERFLDRYAVMSSPTTPRAPCSRPPTRRAARGRALFRSSRRSRPGATASWR